MMQKRLFDILVSILVLALFGPLVLLLAACIVFSSGRPAFYSGWRAGRAGAPFRIIKLRTMVANAENQGGAETPSDDARITRFGVFLRQYKLDELPQFVNVLLGDMSIVGPRPEVFEEICQYGSKEREVLSLRPGITDWASIKFRHEDEMLCGAADPHEAYHTLIQPEKIALGLKYTRNRSMKIDLLIIAKTASAVFRRNV
ncbi:MAG: sugar transferase [Bryobacteraceae bacterium]|jgi:lipopolysaccharide/colanic/teichoic acid biosynthesis glycosyltransferase